MSPNDANAVLKEYGNLASHYDRRWEFYIEETLRETQTRLGLAPGESLLDVGCGTGALLEALSVFAPDAKLSGIDPSSEMLKIARRKLAKSIELTQGYAECLPYPDATFDVVVSVSAFHYFRDPLCALREMARVLRPGGRLVLTDWCDDFIACRVCDLWLRLFNRAHFRTYGEKQCRGFLEQAGFENVRVDRYKIDWFWGLMTAIAQRQVAHDSQPTTRIVRG